MRKHGIILAALGVVVLVVAAYAQSTPATTKPGAENHEQMGGMMNGAMGGMMAGDKEMMAERHEMMADMDAEAAKLDALIAQMNSTDGVKKVDAMANVITELVAQQKGMRHQMMSMQPEMMQHMMQHMKSGTMEGMQKSMSMCPMMKSADALGASGATNDSDHEKHHPGTKQ